ncbi:MAG: hypothetical protein M1404_02380, partial [Acidobacteria bacterium]|nr:hypothetical protein [Acidobacteriota bacterium]
VTATYVQGGSFMITARRTLVTSLLLGMALPCLALAAQQNAQQNNLATSDTSASIGNTTQAKTKNKFAGIILPAGSSLHVRLQTTLTSKTNKTGDKFTGYVEQPVTSDGKTIVPTGSLVDGHVVFVKKSKRIKGVGEMRIVLDDITTENGDEFLLNGSLDEAQGSPCARTAHDSEGTIKGCGKSAKSALKGAAIAGAMGAGAGATVGMGHEIDCQYFGACGGPSFGADVGYGAAIGAGAALIYNVFKHEKALVLLQGTHLTFIVDRSVAARPMPASASIPATSD